MLKQLEQLVAGPSRSEKAPHVGAVIVCAPAHRVRAGVRHAVHLRASVSGMRVEPHLDGGVDVAPHRVGGNTEVRSANKVERSSFVAVDGGVAEAQTTEVGGVHGGAAHTCRGVYLRN